MDTRLARFAGWGAYLSGLVGVLDFVFIILFFALEAQQASANPRQRFYWSTLDEFALVAQMVPLLLVAVTLYQIEQARAARLSLVASVIGIEGILGVALFQILLIIRAMRFEQGIGLVMSATTAVGVWLVFVNHLGRAQTILPSLLAWLGIAVGAAFVLQPVMFLAIGGSVGLRHIQSNYIALIPSILIYLVSNVGLPIWAIWLGRVLTTTNRGSTALE